jgi:hypothetical protein
MPGKNIDLSDENPLIHFISIGTRLVLKLHPLFDTAFYTARYAGELPEGMNPSPTFSQSAARPCFDHHPLFDSSWYLAQHPQLRGQNPLLHYLTDGWRASAAPPIRRRALSPEASRRDGRRRQPA